MTKRQFIIGYILICMDVVLMFYYLIIITYVELAVSSCNECGIMAQSATKKSGLYTAVAKAPPHHDRHIMFLN